MVLNIFMTLLQKCQKVLAVLTSPGFESSFFQLRTHHFSMGASINRCLRQTDYSLLIIMMFDFYIKMGAVIGRKWLQCYQYRHILILQAMLLSISKLTASNSSIDVPCRNVSTLDDPYDPCVVHSPRFMLTWILKKLQRQTVPTKNHQVSIFELTSC